MSERHQEGLAHLLYGINEGGGFIALTGEVGTGKTTLCHCLLQQLPEHVDVALILNPKLNAIELLASLCDELGIQYQPQFLSLKHLVDVLNQYLLNAHTHNRRTVLLIDEAQNLSLEVLEQIRLLTNLETTKTKLLQIILVGQPELKQLLERQELRQLNQRITARYHLQPLTYAETQAYIRHRLSVGNGNPELFKASAIRKIYQLSSGIPRVINILCDRALLGAYANNRQLVDVSLVKQAAKETLLPPAKPKTLAYSAIIFSLVAGLVFYGLNRPQPANNKLIVAGRLPAAPTAHKPALDKNKIVELLSTADVSLPQATAKALKIWQKPVTVLAASCADAAAFGLYCLFDKTDWQHLIELDRPSILELTTATGEKRFALLKGIRKAQAILQLDQEITVPIADLLTVWQGYYLVLWQPPFPNLTDIKPPLNSPAVLWLSQQLNRIDNTTAKPHQGQNFDPALKQQLQAFQQRQHLTADGIAGGLTLIHIENLTDPKRSPHLVKGE
ncbi:MAG: AAA family ATPase [Methylococcaceae bacterium]